MNGVSAKYFIALFFLLITAGVYSCKKTCDDGKQNQKETEIDCGGPCEPCATCFDGIKNGLESQIDCGGNCKECPIGSQFVEINSGVTINLNKVDCHNNNCAIIGEDGIVLISEDKGQNWIEGETGTKDSIKGIEVIENVVFICGEKGMVKKSTDNGKTFKELNVIPQSITWYDLLFFDTDTGVICGENLSIYYTYNGGESWTRSVRSASTDRSYYALSSPKKGLIYVIGSNSVQVSENFGKSWSNSGLATTNPPMNFFTDLYYYSPSRAFATGSSSILFSTNSIEWYDKALYAKNGGISFYNAEGLFAGRNVEESQGKLITSSDSGVSWTQIPLEDNKTLLNDCFIIDESNSIIIGENGKIFRR